MSDLDFSRVFWINKWLIRAFMGLVILDRTSPLVFFSLGTWVTSFEVKMLTFSFTTRPNIFAKRVLWHGPLVRLVIPPIGSSFVLRYPTLQLLSE